MSVSTIQKSIYFVDSNLPDIDALLAGLPEGAEIVMISPESDGVTQMLAAINGREGFAAFHVLTHGAPGKVVIGDSTLSLDNLDDYASALTKLGSAMTPDADLLFYGCNVAEGEVGQAFIEQLSALTAADVAASSDLTGASALGGDWVLETATGAIEASGITAFNFDGTLALPGAHSATSGTEVFIGGNYIELGISNKGSFGTSAGKPAGFIGTSGSSAIGMSNDADGFGLGADLAIDYFLPGSPEERWAAGYNGSVTGGYSNLSGVSGAALSGNAVTNQSSGDNLSAKFTGTVNSALKVEQTHSFKINDKFFKTVVTLTNTSGSTMTDVRYMRSFDPDNTVFKGGSYATVNKIENTIAVDGKAVVSATSQADSYSTAAGSTAKILFFSSDSRANVANFGFSNSNPYAMPVQAKGYTATSDSGIAIMFKGGSLAAGAAVSFEYFTSLDTADIATTVATIAAASNPAPTLTTFTAPVDTVAEDTQVEITFAEIAAQGNEADQQPNASGGLEAGTVDAFIVTSVTSGTLKIGTSAGTAAAWNPGTNDVINATQKAYWTPGANANGTLNAFKVVARDADGLKSTPAIETPVTVTIVNDAPVIASSATAVTLAAINEDQAVISGATVTALFGPRFTDVDAGATLGGIIVVSNTANSSTEGKWQYSTNGTDWFDVGTVATDNGLALSASTKLRFEPVADYHGTPPGLSVYLTDNAYTGGYTDGATRDTEISTTANGISTATVNLVTTVNSVNDLPVFTSAAGAASLTETAAYDNAVDAGKVAVASGALTGTLAGNDDHDSGAVTFSIRGGSTSGSTVTKTGFYGTLTLDTGTNAWIYTPTNFTAINALAQAVTATDNFEFKVIDGNGASVTQALTITYTGTNDTPVIKAGVNPIADQTFNGNGVWSYQIPADIFTDAEGLGLTYTVEVVDGLGNMLDTITASTGGDANKPSNWLIFNEASRTLSGTPTTTAPLPLNLKITATDSAGAVVSDTFTTTLLPGSSDANPATGNAAPTTTDDHLGTTGTTPVTLSASDFGSYSDANGDALASVKIVLPPSGVNGVLKLDGVVITVANTEVSAADITASKLTFEPSTSPAAITFQVGDGTAFSSTHTLAVDVGSATGVTFAASNVTTAQAGAWTSVYSASPLAGFTGTVRVIVEATSGTIKLADATGVTAITTGYGSLTDGTATSIAFEGTQSAVNAALQQLQGNLAANPLMTLSVSAIKGGSAYNPDNQHYYQYVANPGITWTAAKTAAESASFNGLTGYLATITSATENTFIVNKVGGNAWIGASDSAADGIWKWMGGPEAGQTFFTDINTNDGTTGTTPFYTWQSGEPNGAGGAEDYAQIITVNTGLLVAGKWNDLPDIGGSNDYAVTGYVIEYGGSGTVAEQATRTITLNKIAPAPVLTIQGDAAYTENAAPKALNPALDLTDVDSATLTSATVTISAGQVAGDVLAFTNDNATTYGNILAVYNAGTGVLSLSSANSSATLAQWEAALKAVTFHSTSDNPTNAARTIAWQVTDPDSNASNVGSTSIAVTAVNDAPVATPLDDKTVNAGDAFNLTLGTVFTDPEGTAVTYSAKYQDSDGIWQDIPAAGSTAYWLTFDPASKAFAGNPPAGLPSLNIKVIGSDGSANAESTFTLNLASAGAGSAAVNNTGAFAITDTNGDSIALGDVLTAAAPADSDGYEPAGLRYQWQAKTSGGDWLDINGATGSTYTITQAESSKEVRAQAFYTDNGGFAEAPVSNTLTVPALNVAGTATVTGSLVPGQTLIATLQDSNGLSGATPTYTWYRGDTSGAQTTVVGGNFSAYTLTNDDGGKFITAKITYTDDEGTAETVTDSTNSTIQLGAVAPVAVNDTTGAANEAGGIDNATAGSSATGNVMTNDTDANTTTGFAVTGLRSGNTEGLGEIALLEEGSYVVTGDYGTLTVNATTGAYTYNANQSNYTVQALNSGETVKDYFNYTVTDNTALSDIGVVEITINGANDAPSVRDVPTAFNVVEDQKTALEFPLPFALSDVDNTGSATVKLIASEGKLTAGANAGGVTVTGSDSGTLTLTGTLSDINTWLKTANNVSYTSAPNDTLGTEVAAATITLQANDGVSGFVNLATVNVNVADVNNAPILDLNLNNSTAAGVVPANATGADLPGNDHAVVFRPRGSAVQVVDDDVTITDAVDGDTTLFGATVEITNGAWDNSRTIFETLSSTAGASFVGASTITITGNGTGTSGLTNATKLTLSGTATHADYQSALKTVMYNNSNEGAFAGNRTITISVQDKALGDNGLLSNAASFTTAAVNNSIAVGQKIYIGGADTGFTVASVGADHQHFIASGPLTTLAHNASLTFWLDGAQVVAANATASAPLAATGYVAAAATSTVMVVWTPVVDLNGGAVSGTAYTTSYTEGDAGSFISGTEALITDLDGNLKTVTLTLNNAADTSGGTSTESLFIAANIVSNLAVNGITTTFYNAANESVGAGMAGIHKIVFSGNKDATTFQQGLREVQYKNTSENPSVTPRTVTTSIVDQDDNTGVSASATINIVPRNDAPVKGGDYAGALNEGGVYAITNTDLNSTDVDDAAGTLKYILTSVPNPTTEGTLFRDSNNNGVIDAGEALGATVDTSSLAKINAIGSNGYFTQAEVNAGQIKYLHSGANPDGTNATGTDTFGFKVVDGMEDYAFGNIAANQAGTVTLTVTEVNDLPTGTPVVSGTMTPGQVLTVNTASIADADGPGTLVFSYQWKVSSDGSSWSNATGTGSTTANYTLAAADQGKQVKVDVSFPDAFARSNTLTGAASGSVAFTNTDAAGAVTITDDGTPQAGETLTANTSALTDDDGLGPFSYQWQVWDTGTGGWVNVVGATSKTYSLPADAATGAQYKVAVSYTDGRGNAQSVASAATTVAAPAADVNDAPLLTGDGAFPATTTLFSNVAVSTVESGQTIQTLTLTVSGLQDGAAEKIAIDGVAVDLAAAVTTAITGGTIAGVSYAITMAGTSPDTATITLTHAGLTVAQTKALVESLAFANTAGTPTAGLRVVTLTSLQDSGSGSDTGAIGLSATVDVGNSLPGSNTAPTVSGDAATTVAEGAAVTLLTADLSASDTQQPAGLQVVLASTPTNGTLFRDLNGNGLIDGAETALVSGNKFALADIAAGRIKYLHDGSETTTGAFTFNVSDGLALSDSNTGAGTATDPTTFTITVNPVNEAPTLSATAAGSSGAPVAFAEGDAAKALFSAASASTVDTGQNITELMVMVSGLRDGAAEKLVVDGTSVALTHGTTGVSTGGSTVGYAVSVTGGTATVTLTKTAAAGTWNGFVDGLKYENTSESPTAGQRSVTLTKLTDNGSDNNISDLELTSVVAVTAVNDAPTLSTTGITVTEGGSITLTTTHAAAADVDHALSGLIYTLGTAPGQGSVYIDADGDGVKDDGEALAANGTFSHAQLTAGQVRYAHDGSENGDTFALTVKDPANAASAPASITVTRTATNDAPTISGLGSDVLTYPANSGAKTLEQDGNALISDPDSTNFDSGSLRVSVSFNRDPAHDVLSIQNVGTAAGQISVGSGTVSYAGTQIGTFTGGTGTADLVVTFDANATPAAVTALVKAIQFSNDQAAPALTSRTVSFTLNDGNLNGEAAPVAVNVNLLTGVTPSISIGNGFFVTENTQSVTTLSATDPNSRPITFSIDSAVDAVNNPDSGKFEIVSGNLLRLKSAPDYESPDDTGADRTYKVVVKATNDIGSSATQALSVTVLDQDPEAGIVPGDTSGPGFGFATVNGNSLTITYTDASSLDATNIPLASAFAVSGNTVTGVAVNATAKTVTLTLGTAVVAGASVTVAYTDPTGSNDTAALQDAAGNDAATLAASSVSNVTPGASSGGGGGGTSSGGTTTTVTPGTITGGTSTTSTGTDGTKTTTTTGTVGTVTIVETVVVTTTGETVRELVYVPVIAGTAGGAATPVSLPLLYEQGAGSDSNTSITLPGGVGLTSTGDRTPTASSNELDLIKLIQETVSNTDSTKSGMLSSGQSFLDQRSDSSTLWINKIVLTATAGAPAPSTPIIVNGSANNASSTFTGDKLEALVIDASQVPVGSVIELENVDFAVVIGEGVVVRGGNGANIVFGGAGSQNILLGPDDDVLYGGDGDDVVGSAAGADLIFGNAGNDAVFGGAGADLLHGGADNDVATYSGNMARYEITRDHGKTIVRSLDRLDDIDTLINVETIRFDDQSYTVQNSEYHTWIASLYNNVLDRQAEIGGFQYWSGQYVAGLSLGNIALSFLISAEHSANTGQAFNELSKGQQVDLFYQYFLGREAEDAGRGYWVNDLENGNSLELVAQYFMQSVEMQDKYLQQNKWDFSL